MKFAILFFGLPRHSNLCMPAIEKNILIPASEIGETKLIAHLYRQSHVSNPRSGEDGELSPKNYDWFERNCSDFSSVDNLGSEDERQELEQFGDFFRDGGRSLANLYKQLQSLNTVTEKFERSDCDAAIFVRPDLLYHDRLSLKGLSFAAANAGACVVPDWQWWSGCNDRFAICGREAALAYGRRIRDAKAYCLNGVRKPLHPENLVRFVIESRRLQLRVMSTRASRVRVTGEVKQEDFSCFKSLRGDQSSKLRLLVSKIRSFGF